jgi:AraC-like DNA-binding protein
VRYVERSTTPELATIATRAWFLETSPVRPFEKILPLPFVHLIVNLSDPYRLFDREGAATEVSGAFVSGLQSEYLVIESPPVIRHVGIELTPAGLHALAPDAAATAAGRVQDARALMGGIDALVSRLRASANPDEALDTLFGFVADARVRDPDPLVAAALAAIDTEPDTAIGALVRDSGVAHRTLISRFRTVTGTTPKRYAQVLRFHRLVDAVQAGEGAPDWAGLAADAGYYDQPHVIRAFRRFSGWTPAEYHRLVAEHGRDAAHFVPLDQVPRAAQASS